MKCINCNKEMEITLKTKYDEDYTTEYKCSCGVECLQEESMNYEGDFEEEITWFSELNTKCEDDWCIEDEEVDEWKRYIGEY